MKVLKLKLKAMAYEVASWVMMIGLLLIALFLVAVFACLIMVPVVLAVFINIWFLAMYVLYGIAAFYICRAINKSDFFYDDEDMYIY